MKLVSAIVGCLVLLLLAAAPPALGKGSGPHATGKALTTTGGIMRRATFEAHQGSNGQGDWGNGRFEGANGHWLKVAQLSCVVVSGPYAYMAGPVAATNYAKWQDQWAYAAVYDGGEPGPGNDKAWGQVTTESQALQWCQSQFAKQWLPLAGGNIQVHDK
jgi:hypothetical protein